LRPFSSSSTCFRRGSGMPLVCRQTGSKNGIAIASLRVGSWIMLHLQEITTIDELVALRPQWSALWDRCAEATPFQSPEWLLTWWSYLFGGGEMCAIAVWRDEQLVGLAPLFIWGNENEPRRISPIGAGVTDYLGFLLEDEIASEGVLRIWD